MPLMNAGVKLLNSFNYLEFVLSKGRPSRDVHGYIVSIYCIQLDIIYTAKGLRDLFSIDHTRVDEGVPSVVMAGK